MLPSGDSLLVSSNDAKYEFEVSLESSGSDSGANMAMSGNDRETHIVQNSSELLIGHQAELYNNFGPLES